MGTLSPDKQAPRLDGRRRRREALRPSCGVIEFDVDDCCEVEIPGFGQVRVAQVGPGQVGVVKRGPPEIRLP